MNKRAFTVGFVFSLFILLGRIPAYAQIGGRIEANIPFDFIAGKMTLPAGEYTIERGLPDVPDLLLIRSADRHVALFLNVENTTAKSTPTETDLVFNRIGDKYFLSKIWVAGEDIGREVPKPRAERELERNLASVVTVRSETVAYHRGS